MEARFPLNSVTLPCGVQVLCDRGIPTRVCDKGNATIGVSRFLSDEIFLSFGLRTSLGDCSYGSAPGVFEAPVYTMQVDFGEVMQRLARAAAARYVELFNGVADDTVVDWDREKYAQDFADALEYCDLQRGQVSMDEFYDDYRRTLQEETALLTEQTRSASWHAAAGDQQ